MAFVKPGANTSIDRVVPETGTGAATISATGQTAEPIQVTAGGFGVLDPYTGTIEILDALPLGRAAVQESIERGSTVDFATEDFLTETEVDTLVAKDSDLITSDLT